MRGVQELIDEFMRRRIILGPDHFVIGDGFGNPGPHTSLYVDPGRFYRDRELHHECVMRIVERMNGHRPAIIVAPDDQSLPTARLLGRETAGRFRIAKIPVFSLESDPIPAPAGDVLVHDDVITFGRQSTTAYRKLLAAGHRVVAFSSLFRRIEEETLLGLPILAAVERTLPTVPEEDCPFCADGIPVDSAHGKGAIFLAMRGEMRVS
ncbi:MAG: hypothetical protein M5R36_23660 [Deltaproteobacteria bacterium]|nr:hypothetical protein [Deltaproteobacteria bacterium]